MYIQEWLKYKVLNRRPINKGYLHCNTLESHNNIISYKTVFNIKWIQPHSMDLRTEVQTTPTSQLFHILLCA